MKKYILLTNDDGVHEVCMKFVQKEIADLGTIFIVAPDRNKSGSSQSLTLTNPLYVNKIDENVYSVQGTPADCVHLAITGLLPVNPAIVISGINLGLNICNDFLYSGTIAAAFEANTCNVPSIAFSMDSKNYENINSALKYVKIIVNKVLLGKILPKIVLNVNIPNLPFNKIKGIKITKLGKRKPSHPIIDYKTPRDNKCYWIGAAGEPIYEEGTDYAAITDGYVSITPLQLDMTHFGSFAELNNIFDNFGD